jgi:hypothetical protein
LGNEEFKKIVYPLINSLRESSSVKILLPQDEWIYTIALNDFINDFNVNVVFSVAPESEWKVIYNRVDFGKVRFVKILTGYISDRTLSLIKRLQKENRPRIIDIGYRAYQAPPWLGRHGYLKTNIAEVFKLSASAHDLKVDISISEQDTFYGNEWYNFLLRCKYFIGVEGGSAVLDPDGSIWKKGIEFIAQNPNASFEEVEEACFPGMDNNLKLIAISPRHLEAVVTRTCQVLIEGEYNGILQPDLHYIELKKDFSNLNAVLEKLKDEKNRVRITENAFNDVVLSEKYSYKTFVNFIINTAMVNKSAGKVKWNERIILFFNRIFELWVHFQRQEYKRWQRILYNSRKYIFYYIRISPYVLLAKLGFVSFKEKAAKIKY